jgi:ubiquinone/menaquinone biosynthesis C-methylase UbiE
VARILLAALFLVVGAMKLLALPDEVAIFERLGFGQWFRVVIGVLEIAGAIGLSLTPLCVPAALGLSLLMVCAVVSHLTVLGPSVVPAVVALALCLFVVWVELPGFRVLVSGKGPMDGWIAHVYDRRIQTAFRDVFPELSADLFGRIQNVRRVLDVGCGPGQFTIMIAEGLPHAEVCGIDVAPTMIKLARAHAATSPAAARLRFEVADVSALPFPDGAFDAIISSGSIKMWPDAVAGLREIHRVLAPSGHAVVTEMNRDAPPHAVRAMARRGGNWFAQMVMPRVLRTSLNADQAAALFAATPFGTVTDRTFPLDGFLWMLEVRKAGDVARSA